MALKFATQKLNSMHDYSNSVYSILKYFCSNNQIANSLIPEGCDAQVPRSLHEPSQNPETNRSRPFEQGVSRFCSSIMAQIDSETF